MLNYCCRLWLNFYISLDLLEQEYDYSAPGAYFVTVCTYNKKHILGTIVNGEMNHNHLGKIAEKEIKNIQSEGISVFDNQPMKDRFHQKQETKRMLSHR